MPMGLLGVLSPHIKQRLSPGKGKFLLLTHFRNVGVCLVQTHQIHLDFYPYQQVPPVSSSSQCCEPFPQTHEQRGNAKAKRLALAPSKSPQKIKEPFLMKCKLASNNHPKLSALKEHTQMPAHQSSPSIR